jgi:hypothetical protein
VGLGHIKREEFLIHGVHNFWHQRPNERCGGLDRFDVLLAKIGKLGDVTESVKEVCGVVESFIKECEV